jgi:hypothetical protein
VSGTRRGWELYEVGGLKAQELEGLKEAMGRETIGKWRREKARGECSCSFIGVMRSCHGFIGLILRSCFAAYCYVCRHFGMALQRRRYRLLLGTIYS